MKYFLAGVVTMILLVIGFKTCLTKKTNNKARCQTSLLTGDYKVYIKDSLKLKAPSFDSLIKGNIRDTVRQVSVRDSILTIPHEYLARISDPQDYISKKHFRSKKLQDSCEILFLNYQNLNDYYIIKGIMDNSKIVYLNGHLKETNQRKVILGGTLDYTNSEYLVVQLKSEEYTRKPITTHSKTHKDTTTLSQYGQLHFVRDSPVVSTGLILINANNK